MSNTMFKISDHVYTVEPFAGPHLTVTSFGHILKIDGDSALICFYRGLSPLLMLANSVVSRYMTRLISPICAWPIRSI